MTCVTSARQLARKALHAVAGSSAFHPGRSLHAAGRSAPGSIADGGLAVPSGNSGLTGSVVCGAFTGGITAGGRAVGGGDGGGCGARTSQPASANAAATISRISTAAPARLECRMDALMWLLAEAGVALALLLFIVWWTMPRRKRRGDKEPAREDDR